jgi:hypothetical protein
MTALTLAVNYVPDTDDTEVEGWTITTPDEELYTYVQPGTDESDPWWGFMWTEMKYAPKSVESSVCPSKRS